MWSLWDNCNELRDFIVSPCFIVLLCVCPSLLFSPSPFVLNSLDFLLVLSHALPLIYHISNYTQFQPFIIFLPQWHRLPAGINKVSSNLDLMKLCQTQRGALVALFSADFKLTLVPRRCRFWYREWRTFTPLSLTCDWMFAHAAPLRRWLSLNPHFYMLHAELVLCAKSKQSLPARSFIPLQHNLAAMMEMNKWESGACRDIWWNVQKLRASASLSECVNMKFTALKSRCSLDGICLLCYVKIILSYV